MCSSERSTQLIDLSQVKLFVCDEVDELLEKPSFQDQMAGIISKIPTSSSMAYFTATLTEETKHIIQQVIASFFSNQRRNSCAV